MVLTTKVKLQDKFSVSDFMSVLDIDFIYSEKNDRILLLNQDMFGSISQNILNSQKETSRTVIINNDSGEMEVYNIPKEEVEEALISMMMK